MVSKNIVQFVVDIWGMYLMMAQKILPENGIVLMASL
jgi:hypothetical protein